jgi:hypothetical protein
MDRVLSVPPMPRIHDPLHARHTQTVALCLLLAPIAACGMLPGEEDDPPETEGSGEETDGGSGPGSSGGASESSDTTVTEGSSLDDSSGSSSSETGEPPTSCDPGCGEGELCFDGACHDIGFSKSFQGGNGRQTIWDVAVDHEDNLIIVGDFNDAIEFDDILLESTSLGREIFVAKLDPTGETIWAHIYENPGVYHQAATSVAVDADGNIVVVGDLQETVDFGTGPLTSAGVEDIYVLKLDAAGETVWAQTYGDVDIQRAAAVAVSTDGGIVLTGDFSGTVDFGGEPIVNNDSGLDMYVAALGPDGSHRWSIGTGDAQQQNGRGIAIDGDGNVVVCGDFRGQMDFGGGVLTGDLTDVFVAKFSAEGEHLWSFNNDDGGDDYCWSVAIDGTGNIGIVGRYLGDLVFSGTILEGDTFDAYKFAAVFDPQGTLTWSRGFGSGEYGETGSDRDEVAFDSAGNMILAGAAFEEVDFGGGPLMPMSFSPFVAKLDPSGAHLWSNVWGSDHRQVGLGLAIDSMDDIVVGGEFTGDLDFGFGEMSVLGNPDAFIVRLLP